MDNIENWLVIDKLKDKKFNMFFNVSPIITSLSKEEFEEITEKEWILKYMRNFKDEVEIIKNNKLYENKLFIPMPTVESYRLNTLNKDSWYVMEKCDGSINQFNLIVKLNIKILMTYMIDVFCWLHMDLKKIHGDIKIDNILIKNRNDKIDFYLIDFENLRNIGKTICEEDLPNGYYYYYLGCENDKPYLSYRMDLEAFGIILMTIILTETTTFSFEWQAKARTFYSRREKKNNFDYINQIKFYEIGEEKKKITNKYINSYLEIIKDQSWEATEANPEVYNRLKNLFNE